MPQDFYTLEQAAQRLGTSKDKLVEMARKGEVRAFFDRGTQRFRKNEIDEMARVLGGASDVEMQLGDSSHQHEAQTDKPSSSKGGDVFPFEVSGEESGGTEIISMSGSKRSLSGSDSDVRLVPQGSDLELTIEMEAPKQSGKPPSSRTLKAPGDSGAKLVTDSDSDVKLVDTGDSRVPIGREKRASSDSDVKLEATDSASRLPDSGVRLVEDRGSASPKGKRAADISAPTEEINIDEELRKAGEAPKSLGGKKKGRSESSEFDLAPTAKDKGPSDSVFDSSSEELALQFDSDEMKSAGRDVTKATATSGIGLDAPSDKGVGLGDSSEESLTFDLESDDANGPKTPQPVKRGSAAEAADSSSEFELTLDDEGLAPLEEEKGSGVRTDMVLPLQDSSSEELSLSDDSGSSSDINLETSDFELALDEEGAAAEGDTGSEVIVIDDEVEEGESTAIRPEEVETLEGDEVQEVVEDGDIIVDKPADAAAAKGTPVHVPVEAPPSEWGWVSILHLPTTLVLIFVGFLLFEMLRGVWSYSQPTPVGAKIFEMFSGMLK